MQKNEIFHKVVEAFIDIHSKYQQQYINHKLLHSDSIIKNFLLSTQISLARSKETLYNNLKGYNILLKKTDIDTILQDKQAIQDLFNFNSSEIKKIFKLMAYNVIVNKNNFLDSYREGISLFIKSLGNLTLLKKELEMKNFVLPLNLQLSASVSIDFLSFLEKELAK